MVDQRIVIALAFLLLLLKFQPSFQQVETLNSPVERAALLQLRSSLGIRSKEWPRKTNPCSNWTGISCTNGSVSGINISGFRRTRLGSQNPQFVVDALVNLTHLISFNASRFQLPGSIPDWFGQSLGSLQALDLSFCDIRNAIPASLGNLTNLTSLYLSGNRLVGSIPSSLGQLVLLSILNLSQNSLTVSIPVSFGFLANLTILDISSNFLSGSIPPGIGMLLKLQYLNLSNNQLSSPIPAQLGDLVQLVDLDLSFNSLSGSVPAELRGLRNLKRMLIGNNMLVGSLPVNLFSASIQLQIVVMKNNGFTGSVPNVLWTMPGLSFLDISGNNFTGLLPNVTFNANTSTAELNISGNLLYGFLNPILRRFSFVDLSGNYFEGKVLDLVPDNASLLSNCLQNVSNQRSLSECTSFYAERGLIFDNFGLPNSTQPPAGESEGKSNRMVIILASVLGGVGLVVLLIILVLLFVCHCKRGTANQRGTGVGPVPAGSSPPPPEAAIDLSSLGDTFTYQQLLQATSDFSDENLIKHGHSGDLYRGVLENGISVVIKRVHLQSIKKESYVMELDIFSKVSHPRLVPFLGHCLANENEKFLVYKYMPNRDLSSSLYRKTSSDDDSLQSLDWITRLKIATGAAEALSCLHHECTPPIVHRDVQASSILLDDKFEVRLGSLSEVCPQEGDAHQSRITRLLRLPQSSEQSTSGSLTAMCAYDVYCFGKVLLELVTGKLGTSASSEAQLKEWLEQALPYISIYDKELVTKIVDPSLIVDEDLLEEVWAMAIVARSCLNPKPSRRPLMRYILKALENPLKVVREESSSSARLRTTSSRGSWNAAIFGSWRSSSDVAVIPAGSNTRPEGSSSLKHSGTSNSGGSGQNGGEHSSSHRRYSREIFPEPSEGQDIERQGQD
ncbi:probable LRR receptor-like serine/threonine-protein kinase At2g16250 [Ricinus communis]|uniref:probable LRR receptor-like serine/threonine-protein kinase At2g16250 n=1 Tax=Ricinus communis TaxID=3988 RepID=UPI00201AA883|nr:probable LRR receptor-like serine/threonine-protein kinase At2g16250 [Ricinus communis]